MLYSRVFCDLYIRGLIMCNFYFSLVLFVISEASFLVLIVCWLGWRPEQEFLVVFHLKFLFPLRSTYICDVRSIDYLGGQLFSFSCLHFHHLSHPIFLFSFLIGLILRFGFSSGALLFSRFFGMDMLIDGLWYVNVSTSCGRRVWVECGRWGRLLF